MLRKTFLISLLVSSIMFWRVVAVLGWSNGGYSADPSNPDYGTHDWIAHHALDWLPQEEKQFILDNLAVYLYGTELPDNGQAVDGIGDNGNHHVYYFANGSLQDDASAVRAQQEYEAAVAFYKAGDYVNATKRLGVMSHYIVDVAVFAHVMGSATDDKKPLS
ncbi:MAG: zinc dependent phospholipase C family protein [Candidatus Bathyarchaeia archaeon]